MTPRKKMTVTTLLIAVLVLSLLAACRPTTDFDTSDGQFDTEIQPGIIPSRAARECPALDSQLYQLMQADDPLHLAEQLGLKIKDEKVQVLLILVGEETDFLQDYEVELGTQSGSQVQVFAPISQLCELAKDDAVIAVRPPDRAFP